MKNINTFNENVKLDKDTKVEIQNLRTELNLYKKCLSKIQYDIEHLKKDKYDDGESMEELLNDIKEDIRKVKNHS